MASEPQVVGYVAEHYSISRDHAPILLRNVRYEDGRIQEQAWVPREEGWVASWRQHEAWLGKNDNDFEEIDEQRARAIQEAHRRRLARPAE